MGIWGAGIKYLFLWNLILIFFFTCNFNIKKQFCSIMIIFYQVYGLWKWWQQKQTTFGCKSKCWAQGYLWLCLSGHQWGTPMRASWGPLALRKSSITPLRRRCGRTLLCLGLFSHNYTLKLRSHWHRIVSSGGGGWITGSAQAFSPSDWLLSDFH